MKRLSLLAKLAAADNNRPVRIATADEKWFPVRQFRLWDRGYRQCLEGDNPPAPKLVFSYHARSDAEHVADLCRKSCPDRVFEVRENNGRIQKVSHALGLIQDITADEWQSRWPNLPLPKASRAKKARLGKPSRDDLAPMDAAKGAALEHAA